MTERWQPELNLEFQKKSLPMVINHFGSLWRLKFNWRAIRRIIILLLRQMESIFGMDFRALTEPYQEEVWIPLSMQLKMELMRWFQDFNIWI
jgi:hypothetical protein